MPPVIDAHVHLLPEFTQIRSLSKGVMFEKHGRAIMPDGSIFQYVPPLSVNGKFSAEILLYMMDELNVAHAVLLQGPLYGFLNGLYSDAVIKYPDRLTAAMLIDPKDQGCIDDMEKFYRDGLRAVKFEMSVGAGFGGLYPDIDFKSDHFLKIWAKAETLGITATIDPSVIGGAGYQVESLTHAVRMFPELNFVICHLGFPYLGLEQNKKDFIRWKQMIDLAENENVWFDLSALSAFYGSEGFPFPSATNIIIEFLKYHGTDKLIWGSDIPGTLSGATYKQLLDIFAQNDIFTASDIEKICYLNAKCAYKIDI